MVPIDINITRKSAFLLKQDVVKLDKSKKFKNRNYNIKNILKNLLHVLKKVIRDEKKEYLAEHLQDSFNILLKQEGANFGNGFHDKFYLRKIIFNCIKEFNNNFYDEKFENKYINTFKKLLMSCRTQLQLDKVLAFIDHLNEYCDKNNLDMNLIKQINYYLKSDSWKFCRSLILNKDMHHNLYEDQFYWDILDLGFSPVYLSKYFDIIKDQGFKKVLGGYWSNKYKEELFDFFVTFSDFYYSNKDKATNANSSHVNMHDFNSDGSGAEAEAEAGETRMLFPAPNQIINLFDDLTKDFCNQNKLIMHINKASQILALDPDKGKLRDDFKEHISNIKLAYLNDNKLFLNVFSKLLESCNNALAFKKLIKECKEMISAHVSISLGGHRQLTDPL